MTDSPDLTAEAGPAAAAVSADMFPLELIIVDHYARQSRCLLGSLPAILGRDEKATCGWPTLGSAIRTVKSLQQGGMLVVRDRDSKNGVFMHGVRIREAVVLPGDCLTLGRTEITLCYRRAPGGADSAASSTASMPAAPAAPRRPNTGGPTTEELLY